jgi:hypothetical protein
MLHSYQQNNVGEYSGMATKPWDGKMKRVLTEIPQDTVDWLLAGAKFIYSARKTPRPLDGGYKGVPFGA